MVNSCLRRLSRSLTKLTEAVPPVPWAAKRRNRRRADRFFRKLLKGQGRVPFRLVTDKLKSYGAALRINIDTASAIKERRF